MQIDFGVRPSCLLRRLVSFPLLKTASVESKGGLLFQTVEQLWSGGSPTNAEAAT